MAQRAHDPQQQVFPPGPEHFHALPFGHVQAQDSSNILDNTEQNFMTDFFANPDQAINQHGMEDENQFSMEGLYNPFMYMREARALAGGSPDNTFYNSNNYSTVNDVSNAAPAMNSNNSNTDHSSWGNFSASNSAATNFQGQRSMSQQQPQQQQQQQHHQVGAQSFPVQEPMFHPPPTWQQPIHGNQVAFQQQQQRTRHLSLDTHHNPLQHHAMQGSRSAVPGSRPSLMHFGSDNNFQQSGYQAPMLQQGIKDRSGDLLNMPLAAQAAAAGTVYSSSSNTPTRLGNGSGVPYNGSRGSQSGLPTPTSAHNAASWGNMYQHPITNANEDDIDAQNSVPRKRRKEDSVDGYGDGVPGNGQAQDDDYTSNSAGLAKRRKSAHARLGGNSPRSPASSGGEDEGDDQPSSSKKKDKKPRQNLSDTQKRQNHIMSEKKRRELIKTGYADLNELVPALFGGKTGMSRSESLFECQTYLESLIMGSQSVMQALNIDVNHAALVNIRTTSDFAVKSENNYVE